MLILPAIDILGGQCVRLKQGKFDEPTIYSSDPVEVARGFESEGAQMLHVVDLDGAKTGVPRNRDLIIKMRGSLTIPMEVGGGIRTETVAKDYLEHGIDRIVLGTQALGNEDFLQHLLEQYGQERIVAALDSKGGKVATRGWQEVSEEDFVSVARRLHKLGFQNILFTDIAKDGMLEGTNFDGITELVRLGLKVIASGGVSQLDDIRQLKKIGAAGAIIGRALYEQTLSLPLALEAARPVSHLTKRVIPCLDVKEGRVVKGVRFQNLQDAGDPVELGKKYADMGADELVFLDITASQEQRRTVVDMARRVAEQIFIPFTVGGGINSLETIRDLLLAGADKVALNTVAVKNPKLISQAAKHFGRQCIVVSVDVKKQNDRYEVFIKGGKEATGLEALAWVKTVQELGAGEILLTSMDRDGTKSGFDLELLAKVNSLTTLPVIASGGAGSLEDLKDAIILGQADAVLAASMFHFNQHTVPEVKQYLAAHKIPVRL